MFMFGALVYEMVSMGGQAFPLTPGVDLDALLTDPLTRPANMSPDVPFAVRNIYSRCVN